MFSPWNSLIITCVLQPLIWKEVKLALALDHIASSRLSAE